MVHKKKIFKKEKKFCRPLAYTVGLGHLDTLIYKLRRCSRRKISYKGSQSVVRKGKNCGRPDMTKVCMCVCVCLSSN